MIEYNVRSNVWTWLNHYLPYFKAFNLALTLCSIEMLLVLDSAYRRFLVEPGVASTHEPRHGVHYGEEDVQLMPTERLERVL